MYHLEWPKLKAVLERIFPNQSFEMKLVSPHLLIDSCDAITPLLTKFPGVSGGGLLSRRNTRSIKIGEPIFLVFGILPTLAL